ncbi:hypothetical protein VTI74DRAFT_812 [Chaetomium olivicolor]
MYVCRGCLRTLARAGRTPFASSLLAPLPRTTSLISGRRTYWGRDIKIDLKSAIAEPTNGEQDSTTAPQDSRSAEYSAQKKSKARAVAEKDLDSGETKGDLEYEGVRVGDELGKQRYQKKLETIVKKQLQYATDPFHIAQHVHRALERGSFDEALLMTRMASRKAKVEVSWNHLIDYQMKNRRLNAAVKLYNEMKKRGQIPNAKTYTIIFRGCAQSLHPKLAVAQATKIYNFMCKYGALKPNTIHMNAVLEVCARAGDMENLFLILSTANDGLRTPDSSTFTIIFNALRHDVKKAPGELDLVDAEVRAEIKKTIDQARAIWADVLSRWKNAKIVLDEHVVCAMGRILATGDYKDNDSILHLLQQTMKIPRLDKPTVPLPKLRNPESALLPEDEAAAVANASSATDSSAPENAQTENVDAPAPENIDVSNMSPKAKAELIHTKPTDAPIYAQPGCKTLSLALTALANTRRTSRAHKYWTYFTKHLGVQPDPENYYCYLRTLAVGHASAQVADLIDSMHPTIMSALTFRRGMSACIKDHLNPSAFSHAVRIFTRMTTTQRYPDALAMRLFLQVARSNTVHFHQLAETDPAAAKRQHGKQLVTAVDMMWEPFRILSSSFVYPENPTRSPEELRAKQRGDMQEAMATARRMIAAMDKVVQEEMVTGKELIRTLRTRRAILQRVVERYITRLYPDGPPEHARRTDMVFDEEEGFVRPQERKVALEEVEEVEEMVRKKSTVLEEVKELKKTPAAIEWGMYESGKRQL